MTKTKWYLGNLKGNHPEAIYLEDFTWDCGWYWGGGYVGNRNMHCLFDGCFLEVPDHRGHSLGAFTPKNISNGCSVWEKLSTFLDNAQYNENQWWRIKDLFKQFYALKEAAEVFQHGGHCTSDKRDPREINKDMAAALNKHIETVIIPLIRDALNKVGEPEVVDKD
jgi:hypothetical protein